MLKKINLCLDDAFINKINFINDLNNCLYSRYYFIKKRPYCNNLLDNDVIKTWCFNLEYSKVYPSNFNPIEILLDVLAYKTKNYIFYHCSSERVYSKSALWLDNYISYNDYKKIKTKNKMETIAYLTKNNILNPKFYSKIVKAVLL